MTIYEAPRLASRARPGVKVDTIILHATAGTTASGAHRTLLERGLSYHYIVSKNGLVWKCCPASHEAFHAGNSYGPQDKHPAVNIKGRWIPNGSVNRYSVGISLVNRNDGHDPYTLEQILSVKALIAALTEQFPMRWVTSHAIISPGRKTDPIGLDLDQFETPYVKVWRGKGTK